MAERDQEPDRDPEDEFRDMLRELLSGSGGIDPSKLAGAAGLPNDPASLAALLELRLGRVDVQHALDVDAGSMDRGHGRCSVCGQTLMVTRALTP